MKENMGTMPEEETKRNTKGKRALAIGGALLILFVGFVAGWLGAYFSVDSRLRNLGWMVNRVAGNYYQDVGKDDLYDRLFDALELDKFCTHYLPEEYDRVKSESKGNNAGYGISLSAAEEKSRIYRVVGNSPAELAGLKSGMYLLAFGESEETLATGTRDELLKYLSEHDGCFLRFGYDAAGSDAQTKFVSRAGYLGSYCIYMDSEATFRFRGESKLVLEKMENEGGMSGLDGDTAYIRLTEFDGNAGDEFEACLKNMKARGRKHLVIDLRSNGGGYLSTLCEIASHLLREAEGTRPIVATARYRSGARSTYRATGNDFSAYFSADSRVRVLLDENSASASEALVGAMIDYGTLKPGDIYARLSGDPAGEDPAHSYGKGVMQSTFVAPNGNALRLTVAEIFWPKGTSIHGTGIGAAHGVIPVDAPLLPAGEDAFLAQVFS